MVVDEMRQVVPDPARFSREHNMRTQEIGRGQKVYPKHELVNEAHQRGLVGIELIPVNSGVSDEFVFLAKVTFADGTVFTDVGDANPDNCNSTTKAALPRMAATRAISRALALAINADSNIDVEMPDSGGSGGGRSERRSSRPREGNSDYERNTDDKKWDDE